MMDIISTLKLQIYIIIAINLIIFSYTPVIYGGS